VVAGEPGRRVAERRADEPAAVETPVPAACDEARAFQHPQMRRDRGKRDAMGGSQFGHRGLASGEPRQDRPARRIGQGRKRLIESLMSH
jgi:hypothetical protein